MYDDILFPTDGSEGSARARDHALALAEDQGATLHVVHVVQTAAPGASLHDLVAEQLHEAGADLVGAVADLAADRGVPVETAVLEGDPAATIVGYAADRGVDLIVMPTHGRADLRKALLGSVTDTVIRTGSIPVTVVTLGD